MRYILYLAHHFKDDKMIDSFEGIYSVPDSRKDEEIDEFVMELMNEYHFDGDDDTFCWAEMTEEEMKAYREENPICPVFICHTPIEEEEE